MIKNMLWNLIVLLRKYEQNLIIKKLSIKVKY